MRIAIAFCVLFCLAIVGFGVHLVLEQQRQVTSFSATTTAIVLEKRLERHKGRDIRARNIRVAESRYSYQPVVKFRFEAQGRQFTSDNVFPYTFRGGGNLGRDAAKAPLDKFQIGEETTAYYNPENPREACLIRRPLFFSYLVILLPMIVASGLVSFLWRSSQPGDIEVKRRKGRWIAALWHIVGLLSGGHYFYLAGADYGGGALVVFGVYTQLGLIPLAFALPASKSSDFARRVKAVIGFSFVGTIVGFWLGLAVGWLATALFSASPTVYLQCWGYTMAISAAAFVALAIVGRAESSGEFKSPPVRHGRPESVSEPDGLVPNAASGGAIPYQIDRRPMPSGEYLETLLPVQIGPFRRDEVDDPDEVRNAQIEAEYRSDSGEIFVELGVCGDPAPARRAVETSKQETDAEFSDAVQVFSLNTEPSFFKSNTPLGAFMSWTRGGYYFSVHAKGGQKDLDRFMKAFPY